MSKISEIALAIYARVMTAQFTLAECEYMQEQLEKGVRPDTFKGGGLENISLIDCKELMRIVINSKREESKDDEVKWKQTLEKIKGVKNEQ